jgi:hypothetical protein
MPALELIFRLGVASPRFSKPSTSSSLRFDLQGIVDVAVGNTAVVVLGIVVVTVDVIFRPKKSAIVSG